VDLLSSADAPGRSSEGPGDGGGGAVQRDYGFWCPRELKVDPELGYSFMGVRDCSPPCPNMYFGREELALARYFIGVVSIVCLSATLFTFLTFLIDVRRFRYPERPIIFYAVCYMMVALAFFLGFLLDDHVACNPAVPGRFRAATVTQGSHNKVSGGGEEGQIDSAFIYVWKKRTFFLITDPLRLLSELQPAGA